MTLQLGLVDGSLGKTSEPPLVAGRPGIRVVEQRSLVNPGQWDALVDLAPLPSGFLKSWWLDAVADHRARYVLVLDGDVLIGGIALQRRRAGGVVHYEVLGGGRLCPDHLDLVADPDRVDAVITALRGWFSRPGSRLVDLDGLREGASILRALPGHRLIESTGALYEPLSADSADYFAARSSSFARRVRKRGRRVAASGVTFRSATPVEVPDLLTSFFDLHARRGDRRPLLRHSTEIRRAFLAGAAAGEVRINVAEREGDVCGLLLSITTGQRLATYQIARRTEQEFRDIGTLLYTHAVEDACAAGLTELDLLRGEEFYKHSLAAHERTLLRVQAAFGAGGRWAAGLDAARRRTRVRVGAGLRAMRWLSGDSAEVASVGDGDASE